MRSSGTQHWLALEGARQPSWALGTMPHAQAQTARGGTQLRGDSSGSEPASPPHSRRVPGAPGFALGFARAPAELLCSSPNSLE